MVDSPESNGKCSGYPGIRWILCRQVPLHDFLPLFQTVIHNGKKIQVYQIIRIKHTKRVVPFVQCENLGKCPVHGIPLPYFLFVKADKDIRPMTGSNLSRIIRTVIRYDIYVIQFFRIFEQF